MNDYEDLESQQDGEAEEELVSRSQLKREMLALQALGERLIKLKPAQWNTLGFGSSLMEALEESTRIKNHVAIRRHIRRVAKLLNEEDTTKLNQLFTRMDDKDFQDKDAFHRLEQWRERLINEGDDALQKLLDDYPKADRNQLRQLIRASRKEREKEKTPSAQRKLFKYIRGLSEIND